jgi:hypothetical protein
VEAVLSYGSSSSSEQSKHGQFVISEFLPPLLNRLIFINHIKGFLSSGPNTSKLIFVESGIHYFYVTFQDNTFKIVPSDDWFQKINMI